MVHPVDASVVRLDRLPLSLSLVELLKTVSGRAVELANVPARETPDSRNPETPYAIVYPLGVALYGGTYSVQSCGEFEYQITSVGARGDQCEWMSDVVRNVILGQNIEGQFVYDIVVPTMNVTLREPGSASIGGMERSDLLYYDPERFVIHAEALT